MEKGRAAPPTMSPTTYHIARSLLFQFDAETAHHLSLSGLRLAEKLKCLPLIAGPLPYGSPIEVMGLTFPNRVGLAAGLDKEGNTIDALGRLGFGFIEIGTITPRPQAGNPKPRLFRIVQKDAIINRMGFNNPGVEQGVKNVASKKHYEGIVGFNIGKNKDTPNEHAADDYLACLRAAWDVADYITVNLSSPNTPGLRDLQGAEATSRLLEQLKKEQEVLTARTGKRVPIALKVAPDLEEQHIADLSQVFLNGGLDGLIATNTTISREGVENQRYATEAGGLSGRPVRDRSTDVLRAFSGHLAGRIPLIGVGGIFSAEDAQEKIRAGASLVQVYTGFIYQGPPLVKEIVNKIG